MSTHEITLTCIRCPRGCQVTATLEGEDIVGVSGNACGRGDRYVRDEITHPVRIVTSSIPVTGFAHERMVSVKTAGDIPKDAMGDIMDALKDVCVEAPVSIGDVIIKDVCNTGVDIVATRNA